MIFKALIPIVAAAFLVAPVAEGPPAQGASQGRGQAKGQAQDRPLAAQQAKGKAGGQDRATAERAQPAQQGPRGKALGRPGQGEARGAQQPPGRGRAAQVQQQPPGRARAEAARSGRPGWILEAREVEPARGVPPARLLHPAFTRVMRVDQLPPRARTLAAANRLPQLILAGALARAHERGIAEDLRVLTVRDELHIVNRRNDVLLVMDDSRARDFRVWRGDVIVPQVAAGSPAFCRSGEGHPVWGRQWCIDRGFGLGTFRQVRWGVIRPTDVVFLRPVTTVAQPLTRERLATAAVLSMLGDPVFNRLALHALTMGLTEPLTGTWIAEPTGRRVLLVDSGGMPVAEMIDLNRNDRADLMVVALRPW